MLNSLYIKNFRNLEELTIESLGRVNLITGKNNTGKSSVLEAVGLWVTKGDFTIILQQLIDRGESISQSYTRDINAVDDKTNANSKILSSLFANRVVDFGKRIEIRASQSEGILFDIEDILSLRFVYYKDEIHENNNSRITERIIIENENSKDDDTNLGLEIKFGAEENIRSLQRSLRSSYRPEKTFSNLIFVKSRNVLDDTNAILFDNVALTDKESFIIEALKIIEPQTQKIAFIEEGRKRKPVVKIEDTPFPIPLQSMGDGINRILTIILALVNCEKGYLLIDEFENGLHHTVQEQLWRVVFYLAEKLDIQVFATTHSWDCIEAYENILNDEETKTDGKLIRLEHKNNKIRAVEFRKSQLKSATEYGIEIR